MIMKKILLILLTITAFGCSEDDSVSVEQEKFYTAEIRNECDTMSPSTSYCISLETYLDLKQQRQDAEPGECLVVTFTDLENITRQAYFSSVTQYGFNPCE